ncbi:hypothetical protein Pint_16990 [Pistacia integerrima]|uniref:Uncharacterized protein n=1 Tax=Pistacia integerrima TaxID=434235 RepID=A0ACC0ZF49_9ROSI|nr:hypothetical protein Pint_16990 [Pistacia integerrima]
MDDSCQPLSLKGTLPPVLLDDDEEDDFGTLQVIQRRFSAYYSADTTKSRRKDSLQTPNQVLASSVASENETSNNLFVNRINACEGFPDSEEACNNHHLLKDNVETLPSCSIQWQQSEDYNMSIVSQKDSNFPKSAQVFIDAINKNSWLNFEDPHINHNPWAVEEDKNLLLIIQEKGISNWFDISVSLGTNRTPFQCLARYQRSLNASILHLAGKAFGESNWQSIAST